MAEPHAVAVGAITGAAASAPMFFLGADVYALVIGLIAAVLVSLWLPAVDTLAKSFASVVLTALIAAYGTRVAVSYLSITSANLGSADDLRLPVALALGVVCPTVVPVVIQLVPNVLRRLLGVSQ